jgi:WD40 repeat protein
MEEETKRVKSLPGIKLLHTLQGHKGSVTELAWSPDGCQLASGSDDNIIHVWDTQTGRVKQKLAGHDSMVSGVAWSPDGQMLASGSRDRTVRIWDVRTRRELSSLRGHRNSVGSVGWSPDGKIIASGSWDMTIQFWDAKTKSNLKSLQETGAVNKVAWSPDGLRLASGSSDPEVNVWDARTGEIVQKLKGHSDGVYGLAWSPDGQMLVTGSADRTLRLWNSHTGQCERILEGHLQTIRSVCFSYDGRVIVSKDLDSAVRLWNRETGDAVRLLTGPAEEEFQQIAFHPKRLILAAQSQEGAPGLWELDLSFLLPLAESPHTAYYTNAKVVLLGDSGVGKTGLNLVLRGEPFQPTESTHARQVWLFDSKEVSLADGHKEMREIYLWDLAGQPGYRLIHQLSLNEVSVALIVFDMRNDTEPFAGVGYWNRALQQSRVVQGHAARPLKKLLVAARTDRGGVGASRGRINDLIQEMGFDGFFATSAKEGVAIPELISAIHAGVDWNTLPRVTSTAVFQVIKNFLLDQKQAGRFLSPQKSLYHTFRKSRSGPSDSGELSAQFETCIGRIESQGLIRRLNFGDLVLLQPERLDSYASAIVNAAKDEPEGLGSIPEKQVTMGKFHMPNSERVKNKREERLLLIATVEELLRQEIAIREEVESESLLVFPSQLTRENEDLPGPKGKFVAFSFAGPLLNIYATLVVRLMRSGMFKKKEMWKNASVYEELGGGTCGVLLRELGEGQGELTLFSDDLTSANTQLQFEAYVYAHLLRRALPQSIQRRGITTCVCGFVVTDQLMRLRVERGFDFVDCPVCGTRIKLSVYGRSTEVEQAVVIDMNRLADGERMLQISASIIQGKSETSDFDVFLCYSASEKDEIKVISERLKEQGLLPWLDVEQIRPGLSWERTLEKNIGRIKSVAVFIGGKDPGPWHSKEMSALLELFLRRGRKILPVILSSCKRVPKLPAYLHGVAWVDFRRLNPDPIQQLVYGITGVQHTAIGGN